MSEFDLHQLRAFVAVSRHGGVAKAAHAMRLTASPVSRILRDLERTTGPLFERGYHDMRPTDQGRRLLPLAVGIVRQADDLLLVAGGRRPPVRWATTPWIPDAFGAALRDAAHHVGPAREEDGAVSSELLHRMAHGEIDAAVVHLPVSVAGVTAVPLARYRFALAVSPDDELAGRTAVVPHDLRGRRVLVLPRSMQPEAMTGMHDWVRGAGAETVEEIRLADVPLLAGRLRREEAVTFVVAGGASPMPSGPGIVRVPFEENPFDFLVGFAWRSDDPIRRDRLDSVVAALRPSGADLAVIG